MAAYWFKSDGDRSATVNGLRVAAERFDEHVKTMEIPPGHPGLADQFPAHRRRDRGSRHLKPGRVARLKSA
jgi:hypothetical protein